VIISKVGIVDVDSEEFAKRLRERTEMFRKVYKQEIRRRRRMAIEFARKIKYRFDEGASKIFTQIDFLANEMFFDDFQVVLLPIEAVIVLRQKKEYHAYHGPLMIIGDVCKSKGFKGCVSNVFIKKRLLMELRTLI
jgi:hypothetical protein